MMHETVIDLQTWADIFETSRDRRQAANTAQLVTVAKHPELGSYTAIQDVAEGLILLSELPFMGNQVRSKSLEQADGTASAQLQAPDICLARRN